MFYKLFSKSVDNTIGIINSITNNDKFDSTREELLLNLYASIHFLGDEAERINKSNLNQEELDYVEAFEYINNTVKHNKSIDIVYYEVSGNKFPMRLPFRFGPPGILWKDFADPAVRGKEKSKRTNYEKLLINKDVKESLLKLRSILQKCL